jgi:lysophospholipase L1-like esterase
VLLHIGTNDIRQGISANVAANNIASTIDILRSIVPNVKIVLAQIIPCGDVAPGAIEGFNNLIPGLAAQKNTSNSPVVVADQYDGFSLAVNSDDNIHPNDSGDRLIADRWYAQLAPLLT